MTGRTSGARGAAPVNRYPVEGEGGGTARIGTLARRFPSSRSTGAAAGLPEPGRR